MRDVDRLEMAMRGIDIVIHAAALKHVPHPEAVAQFFGRKAGAECPEGLAGVDRMPIFMRAVANFKPGVKAR